MPPTIGSAFPNSLKMAITKLTDGRQNYYYKAKWRHESNATEHDVACGDTTCDVNGLSRCEAYRFRVQACFNPYGDSFVVCSLFSAESTEWTTPLGMAALRLSFSF